MVIKITQEQLGVLSVTENDRYIKELCQLIIKHSPSLKEDPELLQRLNDADDFVKIHFFIDKNVITDFLITSAYEPYFYKNTAINRWLLDGVESVECEYIKYQKIKTHLMKRTVGENYE